MGDRCAQGRLAIAAPVPVGLGGAGLPFWTTGRVPRALGSIAAAVVFTVAGVTSSLLAGPALSGHKGMPGPGWLALVLLLLSAGVAVAVSWPRGFQAVDPTVLSNPSWTTSSAEDVARHLVGYAAKAWDDNENKMLRRLWWGV